MIEATATVEHNQVLGPTYGRLQLRVATPLEFLPGQFVMVKPQAVYEPILRRALAVYKTETDPGGTSIELLYQVFGRGLDQLRRVLPGDAVECLGPLGRPFPATIESTALPLLVAGGIGSASLYLLARALRSEGRAVQLFFGAATRSALIGAEDFAELGVELITTTDDGSAGVKGLVTEALESYLRRRQGQQFILYTCGPWRMMRRVAEIAAAAHVPTFVSLESRMACGFGVCVGCVHPIRREGGEGFTYQRVCVEGPVFDSRDVVWASEG